MSATAPTGADWLCEALAEQGIDHLFANPGSTELPLTDALTRHARPTYVLGLHEAAVMGMADGYAQASGRPTAVNVHVQPGLANALSGIMNAARARTPLLVTVGQQVQALLPGAPFLGGDLVALARPVAKAVWEVPSAQRLPAMIAEALRVALTPPCGPVVVSLPLDVQAGPAPERAHRAVAGLGAPPPDPAALASAVRLLRAARRPAIIAGDQVARSGAGAAVGALADRLGAPLYGEPTAATVPLPTDHPLWRGQLPGFALEIRRRLSGHDLVLALGLPVFRLFGDSPGSALADDARLIHVDVDPAEIGRSHRPAVGMVADPRQVAEGVLAAMGEPDPASCERRGAAVAAAAAGRRSVRAHALRAAAADASRITPEAFCLAVADALAPRDLLVDEALTSARSLRSLVARRTPATWLAHRGSALGWGLPAAVGAALADRRRRVMCLQGDGGLLFGIHALWTAAHHRARVALVVADNGGYEILRAGLEGLTGRAQDAWPGIAIADPRLDIAALCRGFGVDAQRVERRRELREAFADLWERTREGPAALIVSVGGRTAPVGYPLTPS